MLHRLPALGLLTGKLSDRCPSMAGRFCLVMFLAIPAVSATAIEDPPQQASQSSKPDINTGQLIQRLGDPSFLVRERATRDLTARGAQVQKELERALLNPDLEIRMRAHRILIKSLESAFAAKLEAFISDVDGKRDHDLPGWKQYRKAIGNDRNARKLFAEMVRRESELLTALENGKELEPVFLKRLIELRPGSTNDPFKRSRQAQPETLAALLLVATETKLLTNTTMLSQIYNVLNYSSTKQMIHGSQYRTIIMKMMSQFVLKKTSRTSHYYAVMLTLNYDMKTTGLTLGRRLLKDQPTSYTTTQYAAIAVARFGDLADISILEPHLKNVSVCHTWSNPQVKPGVIKTQVRDVILALLIHMTKQDHKDYGFELLRESPTTLFHTYTCGFTDQEKREEAQAKWRAWYTKNKPK